MTTVQLKRHLAVFRVDISRVAAIAFGKSLICLWFFASTAVLAQSELPATELPATEDTALAIPPGEAESADSDFEKLVAQLGASTYAEREQATGEILRIGMPMAPFLKKAIKDGGDAERVLRSKATLGQLTSGNFELKVTRFLSGLDDGIMFDGWQTVEATLGDSAAIRELFIQIVRVHPDLIASLDKTTRERTVAADQTALLIQRNMFQNHVFPTLADGVALLLPLADPGVKMTGGYERTLLSVLRTQMADLRKDALLWAPMEKLLNQWVSRSQFEFRGEVIWNAMQWDLSAALVLSLRTLNETTDVETLQTAMQAIARFGTVEDAKTIGKFLDDQRIAVTRMFITIGEEPIEVTIGDTALAAIAVIYKVPLSDLGMPKGELHPKLGFLIDGVGHLKSKPEDRVRAVTTVRSWLSGEASPGKPRS